MEQNRSHTTNPKKETKKQEYNCRLQIIQLYYLAQSIPLSLGSKSMNRCSTNMAKSSSSSNNNQRVLPSKTDIIKGLSTKKQM